MKNLFGPAMALTSLWAGPAPAQDLFSPTADETRPAGELTITATRLPRPVAEVIGDVTRLEATQLQSLQGYSVAEVLRQQPGIQWSSYGAAGKPGALYVRGANANQVLVLIDGVRYGSTTAGTAALEHIPVAQVARIEILRGPAGSLYGADAVGGVIQVFTRQGKGTARPQVQLQVAGGNLGQKQASAQLSGAQDGTQASLTVARQQTDGISAIAHPDAFGNYAPDRDGYWNDSLSVQLSQQVNPQLQLGASSLLTRSVNHYDSAQYDPVTYQPVQQDFDYRNRNQNGAGQLWLDWGWSGSQHTRLVVGQSQDHSLTYRPASRQDDRAVEDTRLSTRQQQISLSHTWTQRDQGLVLAAESLRQQAWGSVPYALDHRQVHSLTGSYTARHQRWDLQANLRHDDNSQYGQHTTGLLGLAYSLLPGVRVGTQYATAFRAPTFNDLYVPWGGSPSLQPERAKNLEGFLQVDAQALHSRLSAFENRIQDLIVANSQYQLGNLGQARLRGVSWRTDWALTERWQLGLSADYLQPRNTTAGAQQGHDLPYRSRRTGSLLLGYADDMGWQAGLELQGVGVRQANLANTRRLPGYGLVNLHGSYPLTPELRLGLRVNNLLDQRYETIPDYGQPGINGLLSLSWTGGILP